MTQQVTFENLPITGLKIIQRKPVSDKRGFLQRMYCKELLMQHDILEPIAQINHTLTTKAGAVRGMHFQNYPHAETKIVSCVRGKVFDVAVDLREGSPTFLHWHSVLLSPELNNSFVIPQGFAHGFQALTDNCELLYFHTAAYNKDAEGGLSPVDPVLGISWPLDISDISERDKSHPHISEEFKGLKHEV